MKLLIPLTLKVFKSVFKENLSISLLQNCRLRKWRSYKNSGFVQMDDLIIFFLVDLDFLFLQDKIECKELKLLFWSCELSFPGFSPCLEGILHTGCRPLESPGVPRQWGYPLLLHTAVVGWGVGWQSQTPALTFPRYQRRHWVLLHLSHQSCKPSPLQITSRTLWHAAAMCEQQILQRTPRVCSSSQCDCCSLISACILLLRRKTLWWDILTREVMSPNFECQR